MPKGKRQKRDNKLCRAAIRVLCQDYASELEKDCFRWTTQLAKDVAKEYEADGGGKIGVDHLLSSNMSGWRGNRNFAARAALKVGIVRETSTTTVGEANSNYRASGAYKADKNAIAGIGPLQTFDMPLEKLEGCIELAKALLNDPSTTVPDDLKELFPLNNDSLAADVSSVSLWSNYSLCNLTLPLTSYILLVFLKLRVLLEISMVFI